jgi:redox-sensing transcriptional repressor
MIDSVKNIQLKRIPKPALSRLCKIYNLLEELELKGDLSVSSKEIGKRLGVGSHNIRKDIGYIGETGISGSGYEIIKLKAHIDAALGLSKERNACIIGLGGLGIVIMNYQKPLLPCFNIAAGFDSNINILETINISIPVYPTYEITEVIIEKNIELAVITEPDRNIGKIMERLYEGGIKGIINFTPVMLSSDSETVYIRNIDIVSEFRYLSALFSLQDQKL